MTPEQQQWANNFHAWCLGLGFIVTIVVVCYIGFLIHEGDFGNPFSPFVRAFEARQRHRHFMQAMKLRVELTKTGLDPEYVKFIEKEVRKEPGK
jgi:hypothetical protein